VVSSEQAKSFQRAPEEYERGRPGWPPQVLDLVPVGDSATVLDLGAGTGKLTRVLAARYRRVLALEPLDELRAVLQRQVPQAEMLGGVAEAIPLEDASVDAVFAGQSFHWFANDAAAGEIARVLRPGGVLAILWNEGVEPSPLPDAYERRLEELRSERPWPEIDERFFEGKPFGEEHEAAVEHEQVSSRDDVLAFAASVSWVASREDRDEVLEELDAMLPEAEYRFRLRANVTWLVRS
jgi:SAM-dependent methyltransferase